MTDRGAGATGGDPAAAGTRHEFIVEADDNVRLDLLVAARLGLSRTQAATLIANQGVSVEGRAERASYRAQRGETVVVTVPAPVTRSIVGEQIPLAARVVAVADAIEAMSVRRPYRDPLSPGTVIGQLEEGRGRQWDPAVIDTGMADRIALGLGMKMDEIVPFHPIGRIGRVEEVAEAVLWLCSGRASFVTGHSLVVDGGFIAK